MEVLTGTDRGGSVEGYWHNGRLGILVSVIGLSNKFIFDRYLVRSGKVIALDEWETHFDLDDHPTTGKPVRFVPTGKGIVFKRKSPKAAWKRVERKEADRVDFLLRSFPVYRRVLQVGKPNQSIESWIKFEK